MAAVTAKPMVPIAKSGSDGPVPTASNSTPQTVAVVSSAPKNSAVLGVTSEVPPVLKLPIGFRFLSSSVIVAVNGPNIQPVCTRQRRSAPKIIAFFILVRDDWIPSTQ